MMVWIVLGFLARFAVSWRRAPVPHAGYWRIASKTRTHMRFRPKPAWVAREIVLLKARLPGAGCRTLAAIFNRRFRMARGMAIGKTFVAEAIRKHRHDIHIARLEMKHASPRPIPRNLVWGVDLTTKRGLDGAAHPVLAVIEHASRAALFLGALRNKSSAQIVLELARTIRRYGLPSIVRTDNESVFTSRWFRLALLALGIRHQRTEPHCPWQNGRVERFFGTLKVSMNSLAVVSLDALNQALGTYRFYYHHVRPHQRLADATTDEAWAADSSRAAAKTAEYWFEAWDGLLAGYYYARR